MRTVRLWVLVIGVAAVLDLLARFGTGFDFARVMHAEAILFPLTALLLGYLRRRDPGSRPWSRRVRLLLLWFFALGGLRPLLWSLGASLMAANLAALAAALLGCAAWLIHRRDAGRDSPKR